MVPPLGVLRPTRAQEPKQAHVLYCFPGLPSRQPGPELDPECKEIKLSGMGGGAAPELVPAGKLHPGLGQRIPTEMGRKDGNSFHPCSHPPLTGLCALLPREPASPCNPGLPALTTSELSDLRAKLYSGKAKASCREG